MKHFHLIRGALYLDVQWPVRCGLRDWHLNCIPCICQFIKNAPKITTVSVFIKTPLSFIRWLYFYNCSIGQGKLKHEGAKKKKKNEIHCYVIISVSGLYVQVTQAKKAILSLLKNIPYGT